jgi:hypothetical protein
MKIINLFSILSLGAINVAFAQKCTDVCNESNGVTEYHVCRTTAGVSGGLCLPDEAIDLGGMDTCGYCGNDEDHDGFVDGMCPGDHRKLSHHPEFNITVECPHGNNGEPETFLGFDFHNNSGLYAGMYAYGWCVDVDRAIYCNTEFQVDSYSSYDYYHMPEGAVDKPQNLDLVNWLINTYHHADPIDIPGCYTGQLGWEEYQEAVWTLIDHYGALDVGAMKCVVDYLVAQAEAEGNGFQVSCESTEKIGVIMVIDDDTGYITHQVVLAEVYVDYLKGQGICNCTQDGFVFGDPHFMTWSGDHYDYHGLCDLVLLENHGFQDELGMDIHIRTKKMRSWSYISNAVLRIGDETLEVMGGEDGSQYWMNGIIGEKIEGDNVVLTESLSGYPITFKYGPKHQHEYHVDLGNGEVIVIKTWNDLVRVDVHGATQANFGSSLGLMGSFGSGHHVGRDGVTLIDDIDAFGQEWQVQKNEAKFFHDLEGAQSPQKCEVPSATEMRRRLAESTVSQEDAELACAGVLEEERHYCIFDVMATSDVGVAGAF